MTRIIVLWGEKESAGALEEHFSSLERWSSPVSLATYYDVNVNGQSVIVRGFSGGRSGRTSLQISLIEQLLFLERPQAASVIELDDDAAVCAACKSLDDNRPESVVE